MKKNFAIYTNITLTRKPEWLDDFLAKYNPWDLHVTLVQARYVEDTLVDELKERASDFFAKRALHPIHLSFNAVETALCSDPIIALAESNGELSNLQKYLVSVFADYGSYVDPITEEYEKNFRPHITISYGIPSEDWTTCQELLKNGCPCEGVINEVVLSVVKEITPEEAKNLANKTVFHLSK